MGVSGVCLALWAISYICHVSGSTRPPFIVLESQSNELEDLRTLAYPGQGYSTNAVTHMTARVDGRKSGQPAPCTSDKPIAVQGSLDCLKGFWRFRSTSFSLTYKKWIDPSSQRDECNYTIEFSECDASRYQEKPKAEQMVTSDPGAVVDGNATTVWAHPITAGYDTELTVNLHQAYQVVALALDVETVPLEVTVSFRSMNGPIRKIVRLQQGACDNEADQICQQYFSMRKNILTISWEVTNEDDITADQIIITLHGQTRSGPYDTNYYIIRDIQLLAKKAMTTPTTISPTTSTKSLRQRLSEYHQYYRILRRW